MSRRQNLSAVASAALAPVRAGTVAQTSRPLRILHVDFSHSLGGSQRYGADLANRQAQMGHKVHFAGVPNSAVSRALSDEVAYHALPVPILRAAQLSRLVDKLGVDVCHGHLSQACKALGRTRKAPTVATLHVGYKAHQHDGLDGLVCVNASQADRLGAFPGQARIIANWTPAPTRRRPGAGIRAELGLPEGGLLVGAVGRLHASKGNDVLIEAFKASAPQDAALVILGEGPQRKALEQLRAGDRRIHMPGFRDDVDGFLAQIDLFVSPSREESFGLAILEAMKAGAPVIATRAEGPAQYLKDQPVTLTPPGCVRALSDALSSYFQAPWADPSYDLEDFSPAKSIGEIVDFYRELAH